MARLITVTELKKVLKSVPGSTVIRISDYDTFTPMLERNEAHIVLESELCNKFWVDTADILLLMSRLLDKEAS